MALELRQRKDTGAIAIKHSHDRWQVVDGDQNHFVGDDAVEKWSPLEGLVPHGYDDHDGIVEGEVLSVSDGPANHGTLGATAVAVDKGDD